jgi:hypothetical protein
MQTSPLSLLSSACNLLHSPYYLQHATFSTLPTIFSMQPSPLSLLSSACNLLHSPYYLQHATFSPPPTISSLLSPIYSLTITTPVLHNESFIYNWRCTISAIISVFQEYRRHLLHSMLVQSLCLYLCRCVECGGTKRLYSYVQVARGVALGDVAAVRRRQYLQETRHVR